MRMLSAWMLLLPMLSSAMVLAGAADSAAEQKDAAAPDPARVTALFQQLGDEEYAKREEATQALIKMGAAVLPKLEELAKGATDPEVTKRVSEIRESQGVAAVKTQEEAQALIGKYSTELLASTGDKAKETSLFKQLDAAIEKLAALTPEKERKNARAEAYFQVGMAAYRKFQIQGKGNKEVLDIAAKFLDKTVDLYSAALEDDPTNKTLENRMTEANMILYATRKYQSL